MTLVYGFRETKTPSSTIVIHNNVSSYEMRSTNFRFPQNYEFGTFIIIQDAFILVGNKGEYNIVRFGGRIPKELDVLPYDHWHNEEYQDRAFASIIRGACKNDTYEIKLHDGFPHICTKQYIFKCRKRLTKLIKKSNYDIDLVIALIDYGSIYIRRYLIMETSFKLSIYRWNIYKEKTSKSIKDTIDNYLPSVITDIVMSYAPYVYSIREFVRTPRVYDTSRIRWLI